MIPMQPMMQRSNMPAYDERGMLMQGYQQQQMQARQMQPQMPQMQGMQPQMPYGVNYPNMGGVTGAQRQSSEDAAAGTRGAGQVALA